MAPVAGAMIIAASTVAAVSASVIITAAIIQAAVVIAANVAIGFVTRSLTKGPKKQPGLEPFQAVAQARTQSVREAISSWRFVYGEMRIGGPITYVESTGNNQFLHMVITLAAHTSEGWTAFYLGEDIIFPSQLDADGLVTTGKYADLVQFQIDLGTSNEPFPDLTAFSAFWTTAHRQVGHTKIYIRIEFNRDLFPVGIPNVAVDLKGRLLTDTRDSSTKWTPNAALALRDYLSNTSIGLAIDTADIDDAFTDSAANSSDEMVDVTDLAHTVFGVVAGAEGSPSEAGYLEIDEAKLEFQTGDAVELTTTGQLPKPLALATRYYVIPVNIRSNDVEKIKIRLATSYALALAGWKSVV